MLLSEAAAPGRVALLGEHCDWAGGASLAAPLPMRVRARVSSGDAPGLVVRARLEGRSLEARYPEDGAIDPDGGPLRLAAACAAALADSGRPAGPRLLEIDGDLPAGRGFSSSAACCLACLDALSQASGAPLDGTALAELAYHVERDLLGVACGRLDQLACALGRSGGGNAVLLRWQQGRAIEARAVAPKAPLYLVVGAFDAPRDTPGILAALNRHFWGESGDDADIAAVRRAITRWGALATLGADAVARGEVASLGALMDEAQHSYETELHARLPTLAAPGLIRATAALREAGALGAKFSGAGGDGSVIGLMADEAAMTAGVQALTGLGLAAWPSPLLAQTEHGP